MTGSIAATGNIMSLLNFSSILTNYAFYKLFDTCASLTTTPELPATILAESCYNSMFAGCKKLTTAPELPATTLAKSCYANMFNQCKSLTTAPALPATTLVDYCYSNMFSGHAINGWVPLTQAPELPATTLAPNCYFNMFNCCKNLNYVKAMFTDVPRGALTNWLKDVATTGTFVKSIDATWDVTGVNGVPEGWTIRRE